MGTAQSGHGHLTCDPNKSDITVLFGASVVIGRHWFTIGYYGILIITLITTFNLQPKFKLIIREVIIIYYSDSYEYIRTSENPPRG